jgi:signal transduction histidine kinase
MPHGLDCTGRNGQSLNVEAHLKHYKDESTLGDLAHVLCHDLGAPSRALRQYLVMVQHAREKKDDEAITKWIDRMSSVLDRLDQRLDDVLSVSRASVNTPPSQTDPRIQFQEVAAELGIAIAVESSQVWPLSLEHSRVVATELLKNVRDHGGGAATIRATEAGITCSDEGPGITCEARDVFQIFRPVHPSTSPNRGLGLARVSHIVKNAGGSIRIHCPETGGTVVDINFSTAD